MILVRIGDKSFEYAELREAARQLMVAVEAGWNRDLVTVDEYNRIRTDLQVIRPAMLPWHFETGDGVKLILERSFGERT